MCAASITCRVAFHAWHQSNTDVTGHHRLIFPTVTLNETCNDQGYNPATGVFTAPTSGYYAFFASSSNASPSRGLAVFAIYVDDTQVSAYAESFSEGKAVSTSVQAVVKIRQGQEVSVMNIRNDGYESSHSSFSGISLSGV